MNLMTVAFTVASLLPLMVYLMGRAMSLRASMNREKSSPFECGFDPNNNARLPFSIRFFLLGIIFIVFDIEVVILAPIPLLFLTEKLGLVTTTAMAFLIILLLGLMHEWNEGALDWCN